MFCKRCGSKLKEGTRFCVTCGASLTDDNGPVTQNSKKDMGNTIGVYGEIPENNEETFGVRDAEQIQQMDEVTIGPLSSVNTSCTNEVNTPSNKVGFIKAVSLFFSNYFNFKGRASESEYWWAFLFNTMIIFLLLPSLILFTTRGSIFILALLIPNISLAVRRLHDVGKSGVWYLIGFVPIVGPIFLLIQFLKGSDGNNRWSE